ncbi:MAG: PEP-CTERM sorting domain-containing protein [Armatimonadota bacterium]
MKRIITLMLLIVSAAMLVGSSASAFSFNDVQQWTGSGSNQAAMVIEWSTPQVIDPNLSNVNLPVTQKCMAFGYRFNGTTTGAAMFNAILGANVGVFALTSGNTQYGAAVFGLGYDLDHNGQYGLTDGSTTYSKSDFKGGIVAGSYSDPDYFNSTDPADLYWGGWYGPNWELWQSTTNSSMAPNRGPGQYWTTTDGWGGTDGGWTFSQVGISSVNIQNGTWVGWSIAAGGLDFSDPTSAGSAAWYEHKHAPDVSTISTVPEPPSILALISGAIGLIGFAARRRI